MSVRTLSIVIVGATLSLAGCTQPADTSATGPRATAPAATAPTPSSASPAATSSGPSVTTTSAANACPVRAATLFNALRKSEIYDRGGKPDGLAKPNCSDGFAYVRSTFKKPPQGEIAWVLFKFDSKTGEWQALNLGTGDVCDGFVSPPVRDRLNQGTGGGC